jgi:hypothetical protein
MRLGEVHIARQATENGGVQAALGGYRTDVCYF